MTIRHICLPRRLRRRSGLSLRRPNPRRRRSMNDAAPSAVSGPTGNTETTITAETDTTAAAEAVGTSPRSHLEAVNASANGRGHREPKRPLVIVNARLLIPAMTKAVAKTPLPPSHVSSTSSPRPSRSTPSSRPRPPSRTRRSNFVSLYLTGQVYFY